VLQCVAVCCSVLQCVAVCYSVLQCVAVCYNVLQCVAMCCSVLQCVAVCCSVLPVSSRSVSTVPRPHVLYAIKQTAHAALRMPPTLPFFPPLSLFLPVLHPPFFPLFIRSTVTGFASYVSEVHLSESDLSR